MTTHTPNVPDETEEPQIDTGFTYRVTVASLLVGCVVAALAAALIIGLGQPFAAADIEGKPVWSIRQIFLPIVFVVCGIILFYAVFNLPMRIAKRRGIVLDPEIYPWTGAVLVGVLAVVLFVGAILVGVI
jgi:hypothetical protein